ncbi:MAG: diphosphate--fructose-6-phosphate 1-phosphotransferase [Paludibacteraceae bacterium]|nr:diphosphate--fructose-6-phosphate 1-phosphotransferase [Paludibacteraceae bacterium]
MFEDRKKSPLQIERAKYQPNLPMALLGAVQVKAGEPTESASDQVAIKTLFPNTYGKPIVEFIPGEAKEYPAVNVGVILSGGQAPGGHNVICGLYDGLKRINRDSKLYGVLGGPSGLTDHKYKELTGDIIDRYRNSGGFDMIGSGRTKLEEEWQFDKGAEICKRLGITAIVIIGGDDSNTNACILAEYYAAKNIDIKVIGCPKTIDGDLKNKNIEISFGFDTASKVYSELIGNIQRDANSAKKYWHFIRLMGRSASHITLECALQTHPNVCIISEEVEAKNWSLADVVNLIVDSVVRRAEKGDNFGTVLVPEGLLEFVPEMKALIAELNDLLAGNNEFKMLQTDADKYSYVLKALSSRNASVFETLPLFIAKQLTMDRDAHGNVQVSLIETEKMLIEMVRKRLSILRENGQYKGKFASLSHFFGYEGRCAFPSNFDADYCYSLGFNASILVAEGMTGYMSTIRNTYYSSEKWIAGGVPIVSMMNIERRNGKNVPVIKKALVNLDDAPFRCLEALRPSWSGANDTFAYPGPVQFFGPTEVCDRRVRTLYLETEARDGEDAVKG